MFTRFAWSIIVCGTALAVGAGDVLAECSINGAQGIPDGVANARMSVGSGQPCTMRNFTDSKKNGDARRYPTTNMVLVSGPGNGNAVVTGSRVVYTSKRGFTGTDTFRYRSTTKGLTRDRSFEYQVAVEVY
jgi:hypothetical protein